MGLTVYEKNNVEAGKDCVVMGKVSFNVLNQPRTQKPNEYVSNPKPEYVIALDDVKYIKGDENLIKALKEKQYGVNHDKLSLSDKSPFAPMIFGVDNDQSSADDLIPEGKRLTNGQKVLVHVSTFRGHGNIGCGFDAIKISRPLHEIDIEDAGGTVKAEAFDIN